MTTIPFTLLLLCLGLKWMTFFKKITFRGKPQFSLTPWPFASAWCDTRVMSLCSCWHWDALLGWWMEHWRGTWIYNWQWQKETRFNIFHATLPTPVAQGRVCPVHSHYFLQNILMFLWKPTRASPWRCFVLNTTGFLKWHFCYKRKPLK